MQRDADVPIINLEDAPGERTAWDKPKHIVYLWGICELLFVYNPWQISSGLRIKVLRAFGAEIDRGVVFRPRTRVRFPWKLHIGARSWIGEGVWFHNQDHIYIGSDVCISQETFLTTGSHAYKRDMALVTRPIHIASGAWITTRCMILGGANIGISALVTPMTIVRGTVVENTVVSGPDADFVSLRFPTD
jgi:putative colanic acid biosynthesis acetyltransferase WcaF